MSEADPFDGFASHPYGHWTRRRVDYTQPYLTVGDGDTIGVMQLQDGMPVYDVLIIEDLIDPTE